MIDKNVGCPLFVLHHARKDTLCIIVEIFNTFFIKRKHLWIGDCLGEIHNYWLMYLIFLVVQILGHLTEMRDDIFCCLCMSLSLLSVCFLICPFLCVYVHASLCVYSPS